MFCAAVRPFLLILLICLMLTTGALVIGQGLPDGMIVYTQSLANGKSDLYLLDLTSRLIVNRMRTPLEYEAEAFWSTDGQRFAYQRIAGDNRSQICLFETAPHCYAAAGTWDTKPRLSADGHSLAFLSASSQLFVRDLLDNSLFQRGLPYQRYFDPVWSPDGSRLAFVEVAEAIYNRQLYISGRDLRDARRITTPKLQVLFPAWSPDGKQIAFAGTDGRGDNIYILDLTSGGLRQVSTGNLDATPVWSPDGSKIVFTSSRDKDTNLYLVNADGSNEHALTHNNADDDTPIWSADGRQIVFASNGESSFHLYSLDLATGDIQRLTDGTGAQIDPAWRP